MPAVFGGTSPAYLAGSMWFFSFPWKGLAMSRVSVSLDWVEVEGPVVSHTSEVARALTVSRLPWRSPLRRVLGEPVRSVSAELWEVSSVGWSSQFDGVRVYGGFECGAAPASVVEAFVRSVAGVASADARTLVYVVRSYDTPIGWSVFGVDDSVSVEENAAAGIGSVKENAGRVVVRPVSVWGAETDLLVPDVRYSQSTSQHQYLPGAVPVDVGDPGQVRAGRGASPFGPRAGWV